MFTIFGKQISGESFNWFLVSVFHSSSSDNRATSILSAKTREKYRISAIPKEAQWKTIAERRATVSSISASVGRQWMFCESMFDDRTFVSKRTQLNLIAANDTLQCSRLSLWPLRRVQGVNPFHLPSTNWRLFLSFISECQLKLEYHSLREFPFGFLPSLVYATTILP